ncbi:hypothetical protein ACM66B_001819 [Microbotryomycetes sp. NB124-2]
MSDDAGRGSFRPTRSASKRASLGAMPTAGVVAAGELKSATTTATTTSQQRKKRALSLGGEALERVVQAKSVLELSPGHQARRKMAPRRSILKSASNNSLTADWTGTLEGAHTTDLSSLSSFNMATTTTIASKQTAFAVNDDSEQDDDEDDEDDGTMDMDLTRMSNTTAGFFGAAADRRKSALSRRVSFAPSAHIRTFTPDKPTAQAQALLHAQKQAIAAAAQAGIDAATAAAANNAAGTDNWSSDEEEEGSFVESEPSMELAPDEVTHAFRGHFAGTKLPVSVLTGQEQDEDEDEDEANETTDDTTQQSEDGTADMDEANTGEITKAFAQQKTSVFNSQQSSATVVAATTAPPASSIRSPGKKPRFSEVVRREDAEDDEIMRQLGLTRAGASAAARLEHDDDNDTAAMDMTTAVGGVLQAPIALVEDATMDMSMADKTMDMDQTADMQDTTSVGRILSTSSGATEPAPPVSAPSTPNSRRQSLARSPRRLSVKSPRSPRRLANPPAAEAFSATQSPAHSLSPLPPSQLVSPFKLATPLKAALESDTHSTAAAPAVNVPAADITANLTVPAKTPPRLISPLKSSLTPGRTPRSSGFTPRVLVPPQSAGRSPGGSLSLRGLLQEQMASRTTTTATTTTAETSSARSPARASPRKTLLGAPSPKRQADSMLESPRVKLARMSEEPGEHDTSFAEIVAADDGGDQMPLPILSLDAFFEATETGFMKDVLGMTGVDLANKRRKSVAPATGRKPSGPPSFADLAVAGACKSLFHQLYQSDQFRLQEEITSIMNQLDQCEEALKHEQPKIFTEWSCASDARRAALQNQFRMIKAHYYLVGRIEWNECRAQNHQSIIEVMEENLDGLRADNAIVDASEFNEVLPALEQRKAALLAELHAERQRDVELSACDQEELEAMHAAVAEQADELEKLERGFEEVAAQLAGLTSKADDLVAQVAKSTAERDELAQKLEEGRCFTKAEVSRLRAEYEALQQIHGWKLVRFDKHSVQLRHLDDFDVTLFVGVGQIKNVEFAYNQTRKRSTLDAQVSEFLLNKVASHVQHAIESARTPHAAKARTIVRQIDSLWLNARRIRKEVLLANHRFPTCASFDEASASLQVIVDVHVPSVKSSFDVCFELTGEELVAEEDAPQRPTDLEAVVTKVGSDVSVRFGKVDVESLKYIVRERLDVGGRGSFVEACNEAEAKYQTV